MSSRWLREIACIQGPWNSNYFGIKATCIFLQNVMGYTFQSTNCGAGRSFVSTEKSGSDGSFDGTSWIFTAPSSSFDISDTDKYLVVADNTLPRNGGIYHIRRVISDTQVEIDFRADPYYEYPSANAGIAWWVVARNYQLPANGDYVRLQSRHSTGWAIEVNLRDALYACECWIRVAITGDWAGKILTGGSPSVAYGIVSNSQKAYAVWSVEGDYAGEWLHLWLRHVGNNSTYDDEQWSQAGVVIARITPIEDGHSDDELIVLCGSQSTVEPYTNFFRDSSANVLGNVRAWSDRLNGVVSGAMVETTASGYANGFSRNYYREPNERIGRKIEITLGTLIALDVNNASQQFQLLGRMKGHYTTRTFCSGVGRNGNNYYGCVAMTRSTTKDLFMIQDGWLITWPGVTPQV